MNRKDLKKQHIIQLVAVFVVIIALNYLGGLAFFRIDLTSEKRYSLAGVSKDILRNLENTVYIKVYLDGQLPPDLLQFRRSVKEMLDEFRAYAGKNIEYEFINVYDESDEGIRNRIMRNLSDKGLRITDIRIKDKEGGSSTRIIFPGALISYRGVDFPVNLLKNNPGLPYHINLNNSVQSLEFEFTRAVKSIISEKVEKVAFIEGHQELNEYEVYDISRELSLFFQVDRGAIRGNISNLLDYKAIIIAQPLQRFTEADKFAIDQYIMRGGNVLFFIDPVTILPDSLNTGRTFTSFLDLNIYDLLFKYGFRVEYNLLKDTQCSYLKVESSVNGLNPKISLMPWWYYPLFTARSDHVITKGLNYILGRYVSAIDTTSAMLPGVQRSVLLATSDTSAKINNPVYVSIDEITQMPQSRVFNNSRLPVALLAEGTFGSFYTNYGVPQGVTPADIEIIKKSLPARIFIAGDGDLLRNDIRMAGGEAIPELLGYDPDTRQTFGNKEFIMNLINYMTDDQGLISLRKREFKLRLLNRAMIKTSSLKLKWKLMNILFPCLVILAFAVAFSYIRKRKYGLKSINFDR